MFLSGTHKHASLQASVRCTLGGIDRAIVFIHTREKTFLGKTYESLGFLDSPGSLKGDRI